MLFAGRSGKSPDRYTHLTDTLLAKRQRNLTLAQTLTITLRTMTLTLTLTIKVKIIYAVKEDTETK